MSLLHGVGSGLGGAGDSGGALGSSSIYSHTINQSLRFEDGDTAYLSKTWGSAADSNQIYTFSCWFKRGNLGNSGIVNFLSSINTGSGTGQGSNHYGFYNNDKLSYFTENGGKNAYTQRVFRDPSAWSHVTYQYDTTQSTATDRLKIYVNGVNIPQGSDNWTSAGFGFDETPALNSVMTSMNQNGRLNAIGAGINGSVNRYYFDGYLAEVIMLDGVTTDCTAFGEFVDGVWIPKAYSGSYGTNGYRLTFEGTGTGTTTQGTTAQTNIGDDQSGNGNNWAVTDLVASDVVSDSPTSNWATMNPLYAGVGITYYEGNLKLSASSGFSTTAYGSQSTIAIPKDKKVYIEIEETVAIGNVWAAGIATASDKPNSTSVGGPQSITVYNRQVYVNGVENDYGSSYGLGGLGSAQLQAGDILGIAVDGSTGEVWFAQNNNWFKTPTANDTGSVGDPSAGTNPIGTISNPNDEDLFLVVSGNGASNIWVNFGQDTTNISSAESDANGLGTFEYAPPTDHVCLATPSLTEPTIGPGQSSQADDNFETVLYAATGSTQSITGIFQPDFVWIKARDGAGSGRQHMLFDSVRGATKDLNSHNSTSEATVSTSLTSFNSDGFTIGGDSDVNTNGENFVSWNWKAGTAFSNDASATSIGTIDSAGSVNQDAGFSIVTYTGNLSSSGTASVAHGLGVRPEMVIYKSRNVSGGDDGSWSIWHDDLSRPAFLLWKNASAGSTQWIIFDAVRNTFNYADLQLRPNETTAEIDGGDSYGIDLLSNGFKVRSSDSNFNGSGNTIIYLAFAEQPFKFANSR
jgi:hypothetical protein